MNFHLIFVTIILFNCILYMIILIFKSLVNRENCCIYIFIKIFTRYYTYINKFQSRDQTGIEIAIQSN